MTDSVELSFFATHEWIFNIYWQITDLQHIPNALLDGPSPQTRVMKRIRAQVLTIQINTFLSSKLQH